MSGCRATVIVVSRSEAVIFSPESLNWNRKSSKMGRVLFEPMTPLMAWRLFNSFKLDTINFIFLCVFN